MPVNDLFCLLISFVPFCVMALTVTCIFKIGNNIVKLFYIELTMCDPGIKCIRDGTWQRKPFKLYQRPQGYKPLRVVGYWSPQKCSLGASLIQC